MIAVTHGAPPAILATNVRGLRPEQRTYEELSSETKAALRESLLDDQGYLCAYCMRRVSDAAHARLEHVYPQSRSLREGHPEQTIDYGNMLAACDGGSGRPASEQTCDVHKGDKLISINPFSQDDIDTIRYRRDGTICSTNPAFDRDLCETLNLNCEASYLPQNRERVLAELQNTIERANPKTREAKRAFAKRMLSSIRSVPKKEPYVGAAIYQLERWAR